MPIVKVNIYDQTGTNLYFTCDLDIDTYPIVTSTGLSNFLELSHQRG